MTRSETTPSIFRKGKRPAGSEAGRREPGPGSHRFARIARTGMGTGSGQNHEQKGAKTAKKEADRPLFPLLPSVQLPAARKIPARTEFQQKETKPTKDASVCLPLGTPLFPLLPSAQLPVARASVERMSIWADLHNLHNDFSMLNACIQTP